MSFRTRCRKVVFGPTNGEALRSDIATGIGEGIGKELTKTVIVGAFEGMKLGVRGIAATGRFVADKAGQAKDAVVSKANELRGIETPASPEAPAAERTGTDDAPVTSDDEEGD